MRHWRAAISFAGRLSCSTMHRAARSSHVPASFNATLIIPTMHVTDANAALALFQGVLFHASGAQHQFAEGAA